MKKLLTMIAVLGLVATIGMAVDSDDYEMPVYCYTDNTHAPVLPSVSGYQSHAERSGYNNPGDIWGYNPFTAGFRNQIWYHSFGPLLQVELSDTLLYWDVIKEAIFAPGGVMPGADTATILAGCRIDNGTGITLRVYSDNEDNGGANVTFSGAADVVTTSGPAKTFPTYYAFTENANAIPPKDSLIRANDLNSTVINVPANTDWIRYLWSALDVEKKSTKAVYRDDMFITVANISP